MKRGRQRAYKCGSCKSCLGKGKLKCLNSPPSEPNKHHKTTTDPVNRKHRDPSKFKHCHQVEIKYAKGHIRDRRLSFSNARSSTHNRMAGCKFSSNIEQQTLWEDQLKQSKATLEENRLKQLKKEQQEHDRRKTLRPRRSNDDSESDDDSENEPMEDVDTVSPLEKLIDIARSMGIDDDELEQMQRTMIHSGSSSSSAADLEGKRTGDNLGTTLTNVLVSILKSLQFEDDNDVGALFNLMKRCPTFKRKIDGSIGNVNKVTATLDELKGDIADAWRQAKRENDEHRATEMLSIAVKAIASDNEVRSLFEVILPIEVGVTVLIGEKEIGRERLRFKKGRAGVVKNVDGDLVDIETSSNCILTNVNIETVQHIDTLRLSKQKITQARQHRDENGPGGSTAETATVEYKTITLDQIEEFCEWFMDESITSVCKMSSRNLKAGHMRFIRHNVNKLLYDKYYVPSTTTDPLTYNTFQFLFNDPIFIVKGPDACVCVMCYRYGYRGIQLRGSEVLDLIAQKLGEHVVKRMRKRLDQVVNFELTERSKHVDFESSDGNHCLTHLCSSRADERLGCKCSHSRSTPDLRDPPGPQELWSAVGGRIGTNRYTKHLPGRPSVKMKMEKDINITKIAYHKEMTYVMYVIFNQNRQKQQRKLVNEWLGVHTVNCVLVMGKKAGLLLDVPIKWLVKHVDQ
jgi:hypothetical protein